MIPSEKGRNVIAIGKDVMLFPLPQTSCCSKMHRNFAKTHPTTVHRLSPALSGSYVVISRHLSAVRNFKLFLAPTTSTFDCFLSGSDENATKIAKKPAKNPIYASEKASISAPNSSTSNYWSQVTRDLLPAQINIDIRGGKAFDLPQPEYTVGDGIRCCTI